MSSTTLKSVDVYLQGAEIAVKLCTSEQVNSNSPSIDILASIDTSSLYTVIQEGIATSLGLEPAGMTTITTTTTLNFRAYFYSMWVAFPEKDLAFKVCAVEVPYVLRPSMHVKCLIGRDILEHGSLYYSGLNNTFKLVFWKR